MSRNSRLLTKTYEEKFVGVNMSLLNSPAWIALDRAAQALFFDLRVKVNGYNNGNINAILSELVHRGWTSSATLAKCLRQLESLGFIAKTRATVGVEKGSKVCNLYRFTDLAVLRQQKQHIQASTATHDYRAYVALRDAKHAVSAASPTQKKRSLQKLKRHPSEIEAIAVNNASLIEVGPKTKTQKLKRQIVNYAVQTQ